MEKVLDDNEKAIRNYLLLIGFTRVQALEILIQLGENDAFRCAMQVACELTPSR